MPADDTTTRATRIAASSRAIGRGRASAAILVGALAGGVAFAQPTPAAAFLDFLFGRPEAPAPSRPPLDVSVDPSRRAPARVGRRKDARPKHAKEDGQRRPPGRHQVQKSIDPTANPDWYLSDPNIRYGDILILKSGPVVYKGSGRARSREDFVSLGASGIVSSSSLRDIRMKVSGVWTPPEKSTARKPRRARR